MLSKRRKSPCVANSRSGPTQSHNIVTYLYILILKKKSINKTVSTQKNLKSKGLLIKKNIHSNIFKYDESLSFLLNFKLVDTTLNMSLK